MELSRIMWIFVEYGRSEDVTIALKVAHDGNSVCISDLFETCISPQFSLLAPEARNENGAFAGLKAIVISAKSFEITTKQEKNAVLFYSRLHFKCVNAALSIRKRGL